MKILIHTNIYILSVRCFPWYIFKIRKFVILALLCYPLIFPQKISPFGTAVWLAIANIYEQEALL